MAGGLRMGMMRLGAKLLGVGLLGALAVQVTGLPTLTPAAPGSRDPAVKPAIRAVPAPTAKPVAAPAPVAPATADGFVVKRVLPIEGPLDHGVWLWDDAGVPAGPLVITVDLAAQTLSVFRGGYEIGVAVIVYGADEKPTPLGVHPITEKDADHVSNLYGAPMPYMLRLTNDGVAIHASDVEWGAATHGCIGVPTPFARRLFAEAKLGDRVIITSGKMMDLGGLAPAA